MRNMSKISIQDKIDDAKIKVDKALYLKDLLFLIEPMEANDDSYTAYCYLSEYNGQEKFGILGFDEKTRKPEYVVEWIQMSKRNEIEGVENPESYILLKNEKEFVEYFTGKSLTKILDDRKK